MAFYSDFAGEYEKIFPLREGTLQFLDRWLPEDARILDMGCGTGHYCGHLARTGRHCLGIDLDPGMILQAEKTYPDPAFRILDMRRAGNLQLDSFGGVYCIGNVLPHLPAAELPMHLAAVSSLLQPGGRWIFQTVNFDPLLHLDEYDFPVLKFPEDQLLFQRKYSTHPKGHLKFQTRLLRQGKEIFRGETSLYPRISSEYLSMHEKAGFHLLAHFADFTERQFVSGQSAGSVYVFEKPGK